MHGKIVAPGDAVALDVALRKSLLDPDTIPTGGRRNADLIKSSYTQSHHGKDLTGC